MILIMFRTVIIIFAWYICTFCLIEMTMWNVLLFYQVVIERPSQHVILLIVRTEQL